MIDVTLDMEQWDCPFIDTTDEVAVTFSTLQWQFDPGRRELETRMVVDGEDRSTLESGLSTLRDHRNMREFSLFVKDEGSAVIRTVIDETDAMGVIRENGGYVTGPFHIEGGSETWEIGFDDDHAAENTLSALDRNNEYAVESRSTLEQADLFDVFEHVDAAGELLDGCRSLSSVEQDTLTVAAEKGYFDQPRGATLQMLADEFDISDTAVSKNLRRGERKVLRTVVTALGQMETEQSS